MTVNKGFILQSHCEMYILLCGDLKACADLHGLHRTFLFDLEVVLGLTLFNFHAQLGGSLIREAQFFFFLTN